MERGWAIPGFSQIRGPKGIRDGYEAVPPQRVPGPASSFSATHELVLEEYQISIDGPFTYFVEFYGAAFANHLSQDRNRMKEKRWSGKSLV